MATCGWFQRVASDPHSEFMIVCDGSSAIVASILAARPPPSRGCSCPGCRVFCWASLTMLLLDLRATAAYPQHCGRTAYIATTRSNNTSFTPHQPPFESAPYDRPPIVQSPPTSRPPSQSPLVRSASRGRSFLRRVTAALQSASPRPSSVRSVTPPRAGSVATAPAAAAAPAPVAAATAVGVTSTPERGAWYGSDAGSVLSSSQYELSQRPSVSSFLSDPETSSSEDGDEWDVVSDDEFTPIAHSALLLIVCGLCVLNRISRQRPLLPGHWSSQRSSSVRRLSPVSLRLMCMRIAAAS